MTLPMCLLLQFVIFALETLLLSTDGVLSRLLLALSLGLHSWTTSLGEIRNAGLVHLEPAAAAWL